ncbi:MAG: hypothetical protein ACK6BG_00490 [Cyanobacteriota bacterium]
MKPCPAASLQRLRCQPLIAGKLILDSLLDQGRFQVFRLDPPPISAGSKPDRLCEDSLA